MKAPAPLRTQSLTSIATLILVAGACGADEEPAAKSGHEVSLLTGEGISLGRVFFPEVNFQTAFGTTTAGDPTSLAVGHHDPDRKGFTHQNIEFSLGAQFTPKIFAFATYATKIDLDEHWADEFEEYYAVFSGLPPDVALKGGRFYTRFGYQNSLHPHEFTYIDQYLMSGRVTGDDSLTIYGGEISVPILRSMPKGWRDRLTVSLGAVPIPEAEDPAVMAGMNPVFDTEGALFHTWAVTADYTITRATTASSVWEAGASFVAGGNRYGRHTQVYGVHFDLSRGADAAEKKCGQCNTGASLRWRTELAVRHFGAVGDDDGKPVRDTFTDFGAHSTVTYGFPGGAVEASLRGEYVTGVAEAGLPERRRISPAISWRPSAKVPVRFKVQYNYDHSPAFGEEHSVWAQFNFKWGEACLHEG
jgi:hypothetical protein